MVSHNYKDIGHMLAEREAYYFGLENNLAIDGVVINTCNRVEVYQGIGFVPREVVKHLFQVTAGLKSGFIGDTSVQGQVKRAYNRACMEKKIDKSLHRLFQAALHTGKQVRHKTCISRGAVTYPNAVLEILCSRAARLSEKNITILGVHNLNRKIIQCLVKKGASAIFIGNRTYAKAIALAEVFGCEAFTFDQLGNRLANTDILISATSAPHLVVNYVDFPKNREMLVLDLAFPRDVSPEVDNLPGVTLLNIENIEQRVNQNFDMRKNELEKAKEIVTQEVDKFMERQYNEYA